MKTITWDEYQNIPAAYRETWNTERWDLPDWENKRKTHLGKRTILDNEDGATVLLIEGRSFQITGIPEEEFYNREFRCGKHTISRNTLQQYSCPFHINDITDFQMQEIVNLAEAEYRESAHNLKGYPDTTEEDLDDLWWTVLEDAVLKQGIPYCEDIEQPDDNHREMKKINTHFKTNENRD